VLVSISARLESMSSDLPESPDLEDPLLPFASQFSSEICESITVAPFGLRSNREGLEGEVGYFVSDVVLSEGGQWCEEQTGRKLDLCFISKMPMGRELEAGRVTACDLWEIYPDYAPLQLIEIDGYNLRRYLTYLIEESHWFTFSGARIYLSSGQQFRFEIAGASLNDLRNYLVLMDQRCADLFNRSEWGLKATASVESPLLIFELLVRHARSAAAIEAFNDHRIEIIPQV